MRWLFGALRLGLVDPHYRRAQRERLDRFVAREGWWAVFKRIARG